MVRGAGHLRSMDMQRRWLYALHLFTVLATIGGVVFGFFIGAQADTALDFLFYHSLFNCYVFTLLVLYLPGRDSDADGTFTGLQDDGDTRGDSAL